MRIDLFGVSTHNLDSIDLTIPKGQVVVFTGVSGSGKSSLVFDTIHAEGRFRYLETLSSEVGWFSRKRERPTLVAATGLSPTVALEQKAGRKGSRSRLADLTGLGPLIRILYTHMGLPVCPYGHGPIRAADVETVVRRLTALPQGERLTIAAPLSGSAAGMASMLMAQGFTRVLIGGARHDLDGPGALPPHEGFDVIVDRVVLKESSAPRIAGSVELAYRMASGRAVVLTDSEGRVEFHEKSECPVCGFALSVPWPGLFSRHTRHGACEACEGAGETAHGASCGECGGNGWSAQARAFLVEGHSIDALMSRSVMDTAALLAPLDSAHDRVRQAVLEPVRRKLERLIHLGMGELNLDREGSTLSRGERQLGRMAALESGGLTAVTVVLDEPTQGLTAAERPLVLALIEELKERGDTVLVVEHDPAFLRAADHIVELGPGAGVQGGRVVFSGTYDQLLSDADSPTGAFLSGRKALPEPRPRPGAELHFGFTGLTFRAFETLGVSFPYQRWSVIEGPMGAGKSSLLDALHAAMTETPLEEGAFTVARGAELFPGAVNRAQLEGSLPAGHSHVASYIGVFAPIRSLLAETPLAKVRGWKAQRFSSSAKGGRCEHCAGRGVTTIDLGGLTEMTVPCPRCEGSRYNTEVLEIAYRGRNVSDLLSMSVDAAAAFFVNFPAITQKLALLQEIGLGYLQLGQPVSSLSGGEAQRLKLGRDLTKSRLRPSLYLLDEPATGLHLQDTALLGELFMRLVDEGHTVVTVDHSGLLGPMADAVLTLGDGSGSRGGRVRATRGPILT